MKTITMKDWNYGLKTVSLMQLISDCSTNSIVRAKSDVESLLDNHEVTLNFTDDKVLKNFIEQASKFGVIF